MKESLVVAETFYSIQGEGITSGCPAVFLRLGGCNLFCNGTWRCDSIEVWQHGKSTPFAQVLSQELINHLKAGAHLIITGGEPLMQQTRLIQYIQYLAYSLIKERSLRPFIEVETNGTIIPDTRLQLLVDRWNVSFKLKNSGESWDRRVNELALRYFNNNFNANFKIVVGSEEDVQELIFDFINPGIINPKKVILMPAGDNIEDLEDKRTLVIELCKTLKFRYCDRLHIVAWNKKTGV